MSFCEICNTECDLCNVPMPTLTRQTNDPRDACLNDGHEECDDEPCASCMERWECDLEALKNLDEIDGLTAYHIANHEMMIAAGKRRLAREARAAQVAAARQAAFESRQAAFDSVVDAEFPLPPAMCERQTNDHPINFQAPQPRCLVKNCSCEGSGTIAHLVKEVNGELVPW